jgi:hypothetical protein
MIESKKIKNPFPGLRPFETEEYRLFFGREGQSDALIARLQRSHFLAVVGTSGSGKSSLVRAGLLPAIRGGMMAGAGAGWRIAIMRPGSDPFGNLAHSLAAGDVLPEAGGGLPPAEAEAAIEAQLRSGSLGLVDTAKNARLAEPDKLLVLVDQFEELFRFRAARAATSTGDEAAAFVKLLLEAAQQRDLSIYVVLTMRSDFLGDCAQFQGLPEAINDGQYLIPRMTRDERRIAIAGPVGVTRGKMAEPLINRLLNDVGDNPDQLPILQHALMRTWDYWAAHRNGEPIGLEHYEAIGTMSEALSLHADEAWDELPDDRSRHVAEKLFKALTEKGTDNREIRRPTRLSEIAAGAEVSEAEVVAVIDVFRREGRSFLMSSTGTELRPDTVIDISHESLIRNWDRLQEWVDDEAQSARIYRRLAEAAVLHREGGEGLLQDPALQIGLDWRDKERPNAAWAGRYHTDFAEAMTFLDDSKIAREADLAAKEDQREEQLARERRELEMARDFAEKQARAARRMSWLSAGMAVALLLAMVTAGYAVYAGVKAKRAEERALDAKSGIEIEKDKVARALKETEGRRKEAALLLQSKIDADTARDIAEEEKNTQLQKALDAEEFAKKEAARANDEKRKADKNLAAAVANAAEFKAAVDRNAMLREGLEAYRRGKYIEALNDFENLKKELQPLQPGSGASLVGGQTRSPEQSRQFVFDLGWTYSQIGTTHRLMNAPKPAFEAFEKALETLKVLTDKGDPISKDLLMYETYSGLAHAYLEGRTKTPNQEETITKSVGFLTEALKFQQTRARDLREQAAKLPEGTQKKLSLLGEIVKAEEEVANGFTDLARLYRETYKGPEAEKNYIAAIDHLRKESPDAGKLQAALRELGGYYLEAGNFERAAQSYNQLIDLQDRHVNIDDLPGLTGLTDSYSELAQVYSAQNEMDKSNRAFLVAGLLQQVALASRKYNANASKVTAADLTLQLDRLGDAYLKLSRPAQAEETYVAALDIRMRGDEETIKKEAWRSSEKLGNMFYDQIKDKPYEENIQNPEYAAAYAKATDKYAEMVGYLEPQTSDAVLKRKYGEALDKLGRLYASDPSSYEKAEKRLTSAVAVRGQLLDWAGEDATLLALISLHQRHKDEAKIEENYGRRLASGARYIKIYQSPAAAKVSWPGFLAAYVNVTKEMGDYFLAKKKNTQTEAAYAEAFAAATFIQRKTTNGVVLSAYASILERYESLLRELNKAEEAEKVKVVAAALRAKLAARQ